MSVKFSVLTSCSNQAKYIGECASSILSQNYGNFEWIVVDDFSDDGSNKILLDIHDDRMKLYRNDKKLYCGSSYAKALSYATGDICGVVDGDDVLAPGAISKICDLYNKYPHIGYIYTQHYWCDEKLKVQKTGVSCLPQYNKSFIEMAIRHNSHCCSHWRTFRHNISKLTILFKPGLKYAVDKYFAFAAEEVACGGFYPTPLYYYRYHKKNMSLTNAKGQSECCRLMAKEFTKKHKFRRVLPVTKIKEV